MQPYQAHLLGAAALGLTDAVLDVGCGNGASTLQAARAASGGRALGLDLSGPMIAEARRRAAAQSVSNARFEHGDAQVAPLPAAGFDVVISRFGAMFFADTAAAFANLAHSMRSRARLVLVAWRELADNEWVREVRAALAMGRDLGTPPPGSPGPFGLADPVFVRTILDGAGFVDVALHELREPFVLGDAPDDAFRFVSRTGIVQGLLDDLDADDRARGLDRLRATVAAHATPAGVQLGSSAWLITAGRA
jgi:SAM-dependent methyltransferase